MCFLVLPSSSPWHSYQSFFDIYVATWLFVVIVGLYIKNEKMNIFVCFNACWFFLIISDNFSIIVDLIFWDRRWLLADYNYFIYGCMVGACFMCFLVFPSSSPWHSHHFCIADLRSALHFSFASTLFVHLFWVGSPSLEISLFGFMIGFYTGKVRLYTR